MAVTVAVRTGKGAHTLGAFGGHWRATLTRTLATTPAASVIAAFSAVTVGLAGRAIPLRDADRPLHFGQEEAFPPCRAIAEDHTVSRAYLRSRKELQAEPNTFKALSVRRALLTQLSRDGRFLICPVLECFPHCGEVSIGTRALGSTVRVGKSFRLVRKAATRIRRPCLVLPTARSEQQPATHDQYPTPLIHDVTFV